MNDQTPSSPASFSWSEAERSDALHGYGVLDTPREPEFDDLAAIAAEVCGTPIAVVNLVDTVRQFFMAEVGLGVRETPLETSFCGHAILSQDMMIVPDATKDPRFSCNPLITGEPGLRFYAGAIIRTPGGLPLGTMCVLDYRPRDLDAHQIRTLKLLARQAMTQIELRKSVTERDAALAVSRRSEARFRAMADSAPTILWVTDASAHCIYVNRAWHEVTGQTRAEVQGFGWLDAVHPDDRSRASSVVLSANAEQQPFQLEFRLANRDGGHRWSLHRGTPRIDGDGRFAGFIGTVLDIDDLHRARRQQHDIMRELSHRMKNSLAMVQAVVGQSIRHSASLEEAGHVISARIGALARAQDGLVHSGDAAADVAHIVRDALAPHLEPQSRVRADGPLVVLESEQVLGLALAIHELATNAVKYGALSSDGGEVRIAWTFHGGRFRLEWREIGGPAVEAPRRMGFGSRLLDRVVPGYFSGEAATRFEPGGLVYVLEGKVEPGA